MWTITIVKRKKRQMVEINWEQLMFLWKQPIFRRMTCFHPKKEWDWDVFLRSFLDTDLSLMSKFSVLFEKFKKVSEPNVL